MPVASCFGNWEKHWLGGPLGLSTDRYCCCCCFFFSIRLGFLPHPFVLHLRPMFCLVIFTMVLVSQHNQDSSSVVSAEMIEDWTMNYKPDLLTFVPYEWSFNIILRDFEMVWLGNQHNWIECTSNKQENGASNIFILSPMFCLELFAHISLEIVPKLVSYLGILFQEILQTANVSCAMRVQWYFFFFVQAFYFIKRNESTWAFCRFVS